MSFIILLFLSMNVSADEPIKTIYIVMDIAPPSEFIRESIGLVNEIYQFDIYVSWPTPFDAPVRLTNCKIRAIDTMQDSTFELKTIHTKGDIDVSVSGGSGSFDFRISEPGNYRFQFGLDCVYGEGKITAYTLKQLSIVSQTEFIKEYQTREDELRILRTQSKYYLGSLIAAGLLAIATFLMVLLTYNTTRQMSKDKEAELLRRRLGRLYSMLRWHLNIIIRPFKPPLDLDDPEDYRVKFFRDFRQNLYLGSDELVDIADEYFKFVDKNKIEANEEQIFNELRNRLADQVNEDYDKYLKKLMKLTSRKRK